jgi:hypothetical protein
MNQEQNRRLYQNLFIGAVGGKDEDLDISESEKEVFKRYIEEQDKRATDDKNLAIIQRNAYLDGSISGSGPGLRIMKQQRTPPPSQQYSTTIEGFSSSVPMMHSQDLVSTNQTISGSGSGSGGGSIQMIPKEFLPSNQGGTFGSNGSGSGSGSGGGVGTNGNDVQTQRTNDGLQGIQQTVFNVDSRDRDTNAYPTADHFIIQLDKIYQNVKKVELVSTEFPNTDRVVKDVPPGLQNNKIVWVNEEDSGLAIPFPEYSVDITPGNYTVSTLTDEMKSKMNNVKRSTAGNSKNHFFDIQINLDTDIVKVRSLNLVNLTDNPIVTIGGSNFINIYVQDPIGIAIPTWQVGDTFYLTGVKGFVGGINPNLINGFHTVVQTSLDDGGGIGGGNGPIVIDDTNFVIDFQEGATLLFAALTRQVYATPALLATEISNRMTLASSASITYTADYDITVANRFSIAGTGAFSLLFGTGSNIAQSTSTALGFDPVDVGPDVLFTAGNNLTNNAIQIELPIDAVFTDNAGGNGVRAGHLLPFKFLFGLGTDFTNFQFKGTTIAGVLGYPEENSSTLIGPSTTLSTLAFGIVNMTIGAQTSIETSAAHNLNIGDKVQVTGIISIPSIADNTNGIFIVSAINSATNFSIPFPTTSINFTSFPNGLVASNKVIVMHPAHGFVTNDLLVLYRCEKVGGYLPRVLNGTARPVTVVDVNTYSFEVEDIFPTTAETGGGTIIRASAYLNTAPNTASNTFYGFNGLQDNTSDGTNLNRSVNLDGENYVLLTSPTLGTFSNSGVVNNAKRNKVDNVFAKMLLTGAPGSVIFNSFVTSPKVFDFTTRPQLEILEFTVKRQDSFNYNFYGLDYSFAILITEMVDKISSTSYNSRRGVSEAGMS